MNVGKAMRQALKCIRFYFLIQITIVVLYPLAGVTQTQPETATTAGQAATRRDGQHDFDFQIGSWKTHIKRLLRPLTGSNTWAEYEGTYIVRKVWNGRANIAELEADGPQGHLEAMSLRLYDPQARQWGLSYASSAGGSLSVTANGEFKDRRGEFFDSEAIDGRNVLVRQVWSDIASSPRFEQAFSEDGGKTWEVNWIAVDTRISDESDAASFAQLTPAPGHARSQQVVAERDGQHDFDFDNHGTWKTHQSRLLHPLTPGSHTWVEYNGTDAVRKIWDGRASLGEVETEGPAGHLELLSLRLYNPKAHQWSFIVASSDAGTLSPPAVGEFKNGRGEFIDQETINGRTMLVRYSVSDITPNSCHFDQAFSDDGGKTWLVNFIVAETLVKDEAR